MKSSKKIIWLLSKKQEKKKDKINKGEIKIACFTVTHIERIIQKCVRESIDKRISIDTFVILFYCFVY